MTKVGHLGHPVQAAMAAKQNMYFVLEEKEVEMQLKPKQLIQHESNFMQSKDLEALMKQEKLQLAEVCTDVKGMWQTRKSKVRSAFCLSLFVCVSFLSAFFCLSYGSAHAVTGH